MEVRNLIYHIYYNGEKSEYLSLNLSLLKNYMNTFNGRVIIKVAVDDIEVNTDFIGLPHTKVLNDPSLCESSHFFDSLQDIDKSIAGMTFYGHAKGVSRTEAESFTRWIHALYYFNLERPSLYGKVFSGIFSKLLCCPPFVFSPWHYSGTFFWFDHTKVNTDRPERLTKWSVEEWPGMVCSKNDARHGFGSSKVRFYLYTQQAWDRLLRLTDKKYEEHYNRFINQKQRL